jgi:ACS family hexuronate transporter-like MFS transporter
MKSREGKRLRWWIVWTLFASTVINYINRQTLSVLAPVLIREFHLNHSQYSQIVSVFQVSYAATWLLGGILLDRLGARLGLALAIIWWSVSSILTAFVNSLSALEFLRFLLGMGEACSWPGATKVVAEWFPARERGLAVAIFDSGSSIGSIIAPPLVAWVTFTLGWRYAFVVSGLAGLIWLIAWLLIYHPLATHPRVTLAERREIEAGQDAAVTSANRGLARYRSLLTDANVWGLVIGRSFTDPIWWFYLFWLPQYLSDARGFTLKDIGAFAWIPFVTSDIGNFTSGFLSSFLIKRGMPVIRTRKLICVLSAIPMLAGIPVTLAPNSTWALLLISLATWGYASWSTMGLTLPSDLFPPDVVASVTGFAGLVAGVAGVAFTLAVGILVDHVSYLPVFVVAGVLPLIATAATVFLVHAPDKLAPARK